jgi:hypothetical protein
VIKKWIVPLIAFVLCTAAGYRIRQHNLPSAGTAIPVPTHVVLTLVTDPTRDRPVRLEQDGVFLMSANAWRRGLTNIKSKLASTLQSGGRVRCDDKVACEWLGQSGEVAGPEDAEVTVASAQSWPDEAASDPSESSLSNEMNIVISMTSPRKHGLVAGQITLGELPLNLTSTNTRRDHLLASNDLDALVLAPVTKKSSLVRQITGQLARSADQVATDIEYSDALFVVQTLMKYGALCGLILMMLGRFMLTRLLFTFVNFTMVMAGLSVFLLAAVPDFRGLLLAGVIDVAFSFVVWRYRVSSELNILFGCLLGDVISGGYLGSFAGLGANPIVGARYYGLGNELSALLLGALICILAKKPIVSVISVGCVALLIGHPSLGANGGDMIAVFIGLCLYAVVTDGRKALLMAGAITLAMACLVVWDAFFAPEAMQSHLGRFVGAKGMGVADLLSSKLMAHFRLMTTSAWGITALISIWWWGNQHFSRNERRLELSTCLAACLFLFNDSGPVSLTLFTLVMMFDHDSATFTGRWEPWTARVFHRVTIPKSI